MAFELTTKETIDTFSFGLNFIEECDKRFSKKTKDTPGIEAAIWSVIEGDVLGIIEVLSFASVQENRLTKKTIGERFDDYVEGAGGLEEFYKLLVEELITSNFTKAVTGRVQKQHKMVTEASEHQTKALAYQAELNELETKRALETLKAK